MPLSICCNALRSKAPGWNGSFALDLVSLPSSVGSVTILAPSVTSPVSVTKYPQLIQIESLNCGNQALNCSEGGGGCPINVVSTSDSLYSFWSSQLLNVIGGGGNSASSSSPLSYAPLYAFPDTTLTTIIWVRKYASSISSAPSGNFGTRNIPVINLGNSISSSFDFLNCAISYTGTTVKIVPSSDGSLRSLACDRSEYSYYANAYRSVIDYLTKEESNLSTPQTYALLDLAGTAASSEAWKNCLSLANSFLIPEVRVWEDIVTQCSLSDSDPNYSKDPCCNLALQDTLCCRSRRTFTNYTTYKLATHFDPEVNLKDVCTLPNCLLQPLINLQELSQEHANCAGPRLSVISDPRFGIDGISLLTSCKATVYGETGCLNDAICIETIGSYSHCDTSNLVCVVPWLQEEGGKSTCFNGGVHQWDVSKLVQRSRYHTFRYIELCVGFLGSLRCRSIKKSNRYLLLLLLLS